MKRTHELPSQRIAFNFLTRRHLLVFFKNVPTVIFTLMVPLAVLAVYAIFLRPMEASQIKAYLGTDGIDTTNVDLLHKIYGIADCWMMSGVIAVSCITISLNTNYIVVRDKESGVSRDLLSSPINRKTIMFSYFAFNVIVTFLMNFLVFLICLVWLAIYGAYMISLLDFMALFGIILLTTISSSLITFFICSFIETESILSPVVAICSAAIGFLIGAYIPSGMMPKVINYVTVFFPGTYSVGLLRNYFMNTPINQLVANELKNYPAVIENIRSEFSLDIDFFGYKVPPAIMVLVVLAFIAIFLSLNLAFASRNILHVSHKSKKKKQS
jgi:multidrug/hemolysin transport system permease protein